MQCHEKLETIFRSVFFELEDKEIGAVQKSTKINLATWDSAQHLLLLTCLEEEFNIKILDDQATDIDSFASALALVESMI
jgi:acyl carrier protein